MTDLRGESKTPSQPFNEQAAILIKGALECVEQVMLKHARAVLTEMHDQIVDRNEQISVLTDALTLAREQLSRYQGLSELGESLGGELEEREARRAAESKVKELEERLARGAVEYEESQGWVKKWAADCGRLERTVEGLRGALEVAEKDAQRYRWLCDDLDAEQRARRGHILNRMSVMGKGAIDAAIDAGGNP